MAAGGAPVCTLLVIDDERSVCDVVSAIGRHAGWRAQAVTDSREGPETARLLKPDAIILDIVMPEMDGIEVLHQLADDGCQAEILLLTGYDPAYGGSAIKLARSFGLGCVRMAVKPMVLSTLVAFLDDIKARRAH